MQSVNKGPLQKSGPWLRVGILTLTTFGPTISRVLSRLLAKEEESRQDKINDQLSHEQVKRGEYVKQQLVKRGEQVIDTLTEQKKAFWAALGFSLGLTAAGVVTFQLIRRRLLQEANEESFIQLPLQPDAETSLPV